MKLLLPTHSNSEFDDGDVTCAFVNLTPDFAQLLLKRGEAFRALVAVDADVVDLRFWDHRALFLDRASLPEDFDAPDEVADVEENPGEAIRTELDIVEVSENGVAFTCAQKHSDTRLETDVLSWERIAAAGREVAA